MPWVLAADGFYDYTPSLITDPAGKRTKIYYVAANGDNSRATADDITKPYLTLNNCRNFTVTAANATVGAIYQNITSYNFTVSGVTVTPTVGATYTDGTRTFTVTSASISSGSGTVFCTNAAGGVPATAPNTLNKTSGTGDSALSYSSVSYSGSSYPVQATIASGTTLYLLELSSNGAPSGTKLTKISGIGDAIITFSASSPEVGAVSAMRSDLGGADAAGTSWIALRRGDNFTSQVFGVHIDDSFDNLGSSQNEPLVLGSYDPSLTATTAWGTYGIINPAASVLSIPKLTRGSITASCFGGGGSASYSVRITNIFLAGVRFNGAGDVACDLSPSPSKFIVWDDCWIESGEGIHGDGNGYLFNRSRIMDCASSGFLGGGAPLDYVPPRQYNGVSYTAIYNECVIDNNTSTGAGFVFAHNLYCSVDTIDRFLGRGNTGRYLIYGSIYSNDNSSGQQRGVSELNNSSFLSLAGPLVMGNPDTINNLQVLATANVFLDGFNILGGGSGNTLATLGLGQSYQGQLYNYGSQLWNNNIIAHQRDTSVNNALVMGNGSRNITWQNNIVYDWCSSTPSNAVTFPQAGGCVRVGTITGGSGYTNKSAAGVSFSLRTTSGTNGIATVTISAPDFASFWDYSQFDHDGTATIYCSGFDGSWAAFNGQTFRAYNTSGTDIQLCGAIPSNTTLPTTGTISFPYAERRFTGGTGGGLGADVIVAGGSVVHVSLNECFSDSYGAAFGEPGSGYTVGDSITTPQTQVFHSTDASITGIVAGNTYTTGGNTYTFVSQTGSSGDYTLTFTGQTATIPSLTGTLTRATGSGTASISYNSTGQYLIPGGTGWSFTVGEVASTTPSTLTLNAVDASGNLIDPNSQYIPLHPTTYPYPNRTAATYYNEVILGAGIGAGAGGHTTQDFITACRGQCRQSWNNLLMAASLNDYIRQGLGKAMLGSAYASTQSGGTTVPILNGPLWLRLFH